MSCFLEIGQDEKFLVVTILFLAQQVKSISNVLQLSKVATFKAQLKFYGKGAQKCKSKGISTLDLQA